MADNPIFKSRTEQRIEAKFGLAVPDLLQDLYVVRGMSQGEVARRLGVSRSTVIDWMQKHQIPTGYNRSVVA